MVSSAIDEYGIETKKHDEIREAIEKGSATQIELATKLPQQLSAAVWIDHDEVKGVVKAFVYPPLGSGRPPTETDVLNELKAAGITGYYILTEVLRRNIEQIKKARTSAVFKVAEKRDAQVRVEISEDQRTAYISYTPPFGGELLSLEQALDNIRKDGVLFGVDEAKVKEILENNTQLEKRRIAGARDPVDGEDAKIEFLFDAYHAKSGPKISDSDIADFRDLNLTENVEAGAPLVKKIPATDGIPGMLVNGKDIKANPGKDVKLPKGKNTEISHADENLLVASTPGAPKLQHGKVNVDDVMVVNNVDFSTGNIDFNGNVNVRGVVNSGFVIKATGDITCSDTVEGADLHAGGNIFLKRGIKGLGKSIVDAGENIFARFIERCNVSAGISVIVDEALIHSETSATDSVEVTNTKGSIFGGNIKTGNIVKSSFIGSEMAVKTLIEVGVLPHVRKRLDELNNDLKVKKTEFEAESKNFAVLSQMAGRGSLNEDRLAVYKELGKKLGDLKDDMHDMTDEISQLQEELQQAADGRVEARKSIYPGVSIQIKNARIHIREKVNKAIFIKEGPDVVLSSDIPE